MTRMRLGTSALIAWVFVLVAGCGEDPVGPEGTGAIEITLALSGTSLDPNGATVLLNGSEQRLLLPGLPLTLFGLEPGNHALWVTDLSANCVAPDNPRPVSVVAGQTAQAAFAAVCAGPAPSLQVSKVGLGLPPGHAETVDISATDQVGAEEGWTAATSDGAIANLVSSGGMITVTGGAIGTATITVTSASGVVRQIPVTVYDPMVLDVGPLLIKVVDQFQFRAFDDVSSSFGSDGSDTWWDPVVDTLGGWRALGSLWTPNRVTNPSGTRWMLVVKAKDPTALAPPDSYVKEHPGWNTNGGDPMGSFWMPECPANYVAMGTVAGPLQSNQGLPPSRNFATCVRSDLTVSAPVDLASGVGRNGHGIWRLTTPDLASSTAWLDAGAFVYQGIARTCPGANQQIFCNEPQSSHPVRNVLAVELPVIIDTPLESRVPPLRGFDQPTLQSAPIGTVTMLAPFTAVLGSTTFGGADTRWMVQNSQLVQLERVVYNRLMFHTVNSTSVLQQNALEFKSGVSTTDQTTYSRTVGISVSYETGLELKGVSAKTTVNVSQQFGYESLHGVTALREQSTTVTVFTAPGKAAAAWQQRNAYRVKRHRLTAPGLFRLDNVGELEFGIDTWVVNEYPNER